MALIKYEKSEEWTHKKEGIGAHYRSFYGSIILSTEGNNKKRIKAPGWTMYLLQQQIVNWKHLGGTWAQIIDFGFFFMNKASLFVDFEYQWLYETFAFISTFFR